MRSPRRPHYDRDDATYNADAYTVRDYPGIAFRVLGWTTEPDEDTEWTGMEARTGRLTVVMIGDDHHYRVDPDDVSPIAREAYCAECGQIGCAHDGYVRD